MFFKQINIGKLYSTKNGRYAFHILNGLIGGPIVSLGFAFFPSETSKEILPIQDYVNTGMTMSACLRNFAFEGMIAGVIVGICSAAWMNSKLEKMGSS